ncbi:MAG TPA: phosphotransferase [Candidatus Limnocylindria bacterium]|nr:phosphotransferase [Candidatus Limnocylindria bacterium]
MEVIESGRLLLPAGAVHARAFAGAHLLTLHRRRDRWLAPLVSPSVRGARRRLDATLPELATDDPQVRHAVETWSGASREWLLLRDYGTSSRGKSVVFLFDGSSATPFAVAHVRPRLDGGDSLARERTLILALRQRLERKLRAAVPEVIDYVAGERSELLVLTGMSGKPVAISMQRSLRPHASHVRHAAAAGAWLGSFHATTAESPLRGSANERAAVHGDFWPRNVLAAGDGSVTGVVDWERGEISGPYWRDLFTFPMLFARRAADEGAEAFRRGFVDPGPARQSVAAFFDAYRSAASIDAGRLPDLLEAFVVDAADLAGKEGGWRTAIDWSDLQRTFDTAGRSVFSG